MDKYIFSDQEADRELSRLRLVEAAFDPATTRLLKSVSVVLGSRCLEVAAGAGSVARWMGDRVGGEGSVVAVDLKTDYLADLDPSRFDVRQGDAASLDLGADFDVSHCRYMLIHHPDPRSVIDQMFGATMRGGRAVFEEPDFGVSRSRQGASSGSAAVHCAIRSWFESQGLNAAFGASLPGLIRRAGFEDVKVDVEEHLCSGNSPVARVMGASVEALREKYVATGKATDDDVDAYVKDAADPSIRCLFYTTVRVVGRKP